MVLTIHTDGGARGNPGPAASACIIEDAEKNLLHKEYKFLNVATNNVAEYNGVLLAYNWLVNNSQSGTSLEFFLDSQLVVEQLMGNYKIKNEQLKVFFDQIKMLEKNFQTVKYQYVPRVLNKEADLLVNQCLDENTL